ncbi:MAG TPA: aminopeptidase P family N-terminal domain-containing protein [Syntrophorhabdaceae bacterium]|nr:aminopeptidase P family N-terminal domain-containing protein [Syntrophorhabdaceae bacterium]HOL05813.1 aminopeptidase P family N-terminal domain-containing protein [Syntrophorhabdaceae bacterium]HPP42046.1 aminopeptidase P family N-terminal domain-containing protein [Syntrophorhabdaceae bacterium]
MSDETFDYLFRWKRAVALMEQEGIDALFLMKPTNLAYLTGDERPCALALLTRKLQCIVAVPECDLASVRKASAANEIRAFRSEEELFHGFRDVLSELELEQATIAVEKNFFDEALYEIFTSHILPGARVVSATYVASGWRSAMAHGPASTKEIAPGDVVQVHLAPIARGYTVDLCRTFLVEPVAEDAANTLRAYLESQEQGIAAAVPGAAQMKLKPLGLNNQEDKEQFGQYSEKYDR